MAQQPAPGTYNVDPTHSSVGFTVRHLMISKVRGRFSAFSGVVVIAEDLTKSSVEATVEMASVNTGDEGRDTHLRTNDFFAIEQFPQMTLKSTSLRADGSAWTLLGDLTIRGITKPVEFRVEFEGEGKDPWGNTKVGFTAETEINRKDFGIEWNAPLEAGGVLVAEKVKIELDIQAVKAA